MNTLLQSAILMMFLGIGVRSNLNVALNKATAQSGKFEQAGFPTGHSYLAVDGNTDGNYFAGSCSHTLDDPWWVVDLQDVYSISSIAIYNRNDVSSDLYGMRVDIYMHNPLLCTDAAYTRCGTYTGGLQNLFHMVCLSEIRGRYVRISRDSYWSFCEVEVYGTLSPENPCTGMKPVKVQDYIISSPNETFTVNDPSECAYHCQTRAPRCDAFNFDPQSKHCVVYVDLFQEIAPLHHMENWDLYMFC